MYAWCASPVLRPHLRSQPVPMKWQYGQTGARVHHASAKVHHPVVEPCVCCPAGVWCNNCGSRRGRACFLTRRWQSWRGWAVGPLVRESLAVVPQAGYVEKRYVIDMLSDLPRFIPGRKFNRVDLWRQ